MVHLHFGMGVAPVTMLTLQTMSGNSLGNSFLVGGSNPPAGVYRYCSYVHPVNSWSGVISLV